MTYTLRPYASGDNLAISRNPIRTNFSIIKDSFNRNHVDLGGNGKHSFIEMGEGSLPAPTPGLAASTGTLYVKDANGRSQLFYTDEDSGNEYQMTRTNVGQFASFATDAGASSSGWTFLPGGMLLQYGIVTSVGSSTVSVSFPKTFTNVPFSITATNARGDSSTNEAIVKVRINTNAAFNVRCRAGTADVYWMAIGV